MSDQEGFTPCIDRSLNPHQRPSARPCRLFEEDGWNGWHVWREGEQRWLRLTTGARIFSSWQEAAEAATHLPGSDTPPWREAPQPFAVVP